MGPLRLTDRAWSSKVSVSESSRRTRRHCSVRSSRAFCNRVISARSSVGSDAVTSIYPANFEMIELTRVNRTVRVCRATREILLPCSS